MWHLEEREPMPSIVVYRHSGDPNLDRRPLEEAIFAFVAEPKFL